MTIEQIRLALSALTVSRLTAMHQQAYPTMPTTGLDKMTLIARVALEVKAGRLTIGGDMPHAAVAPVQTTQPVQTAPDRATALNFRRIEEQVAKAAAIAQQAAAGASNALSAAQNAHDSQRAIESKIASAQIAVERIGEIVSEINVTATTMRNESMTEIAALAKKIDDLPKSDPAAIQSSVAEAVDQILQPFKQRVAELAESNPAVLADIASHSVTLESTKAIFGMALMDTKNVALQVKVFDCQTAPAIDPHFIWTESILRHMLQSQDTGENVWFGGEKGTGKSETARQFAARTGRPFTRINFHKDSTADDFIGTTGLRNGQTEFDPKDFLIAYATPGAVILLDEPSNCHPGELAILNGYLEPNAAISQGGKVWRRASDVLIFAADNTSMNGDISGRYAGTKEMNSAFGDRFARLIPFGFMQKKTEIDAVVRHTGCKKELAAHVIDLVNICRAKVATGDIIDAPSIRTVVAFIRALKYHSVEESWTTTFAAKQPPESAVALEAIKTASLNSVTIQSLI